MIFDRDGLVLLTQLVLDGSFDLSILRPELSKTLGTFLAQWFWDDDRWDF